MTDDFQAEVTPEVTPEEELPQYIDVGGRKFTPDQLNPYVRFMDWAKSNPQGFDDLEAWERGEKIMVAPEQVQTQPPPTAEFDDDFVPPALKEKIAQFDTFQQAWYQEKEAEKRAAIDAGMDRFSKSNGDLSADDMQAVLQNARDHELIRIYLSKSPHDKTAAVENALNTALKLTFPNREKERAADTVVADLAAKRKAAAATGSSASAPRVEPEPEDPQQALINDLRQAMNEAH